MSKKNSLISLFATSIIITMPALALAQPASLPPLQAPGYATPNYNNSGNSSYQQYPAPQQNYQSPASGYNNGYSNGYDQAPLQGRVSTAPVGTFLSATLSTPISSETARVGDRFTASLGSPVTGSDGSILLPSGSQLEAQVVSVKPAGHAGGNGELDIRFTSATLPNGQRVPLSAKIQTQDGTGIIKGGTTAGRVGRAALNTGVGAGLGAALGTAMGPLSGGEVGRGAIYGTAIGGGLGLAKALWNKGNDAVLQGGQPVNITLDQPLTITPSYNPPAYSNYNQGGYNQNGYNQGGYNGNGGYNQGGYNQTPAYGQ